MRERKRHRQSCKAPPTRADPGRAQRSPGRTQHQQLAFCQAFAVHGPSGPFTCRRQVWRKEPMAPALPSKLIPCILAGLLVVLWGCLCASLADIHCLYLNFTVKIQSGPREPWCKVTSSVDELPFLQYDNEDKAKPLGNLGKEIHKTKIWADLNQRMEYMGQEFRKRLPLIQLEKPKMRGPPTLQAKMFCQHQRGQYVGASWQFTISEKHSFFFYPKNLTWSVIHPEATGITKEWEKDQELVKDLKKVSIDDCSHWLKELLKHWQPMPGPTSLAPGVTQLVYTTQLTPQSVFIIILVIILIMICFLIVILVRKFCPGEDSIEKKK